MNPVPGSLVCTVESAQKVAQLAVESGLVPRHTAANAALVVLLGQELGLSPVVSLLSLEVREGKIVARRESLLPASAGALARKVAARHKEISLQEGEEQYAKRFAEIEQAIQVAKNLKDLRACGSSIRALELPRGHPDRQILASLLKERATALGIRAPRTKNSRRCLRVSNERALREAQEAPPPLPPEEPAIDVGQEGGER